MESPGLEVTSTTTSNISLRMVQKQSGLFDNEYAGIKDLLEAGLDENMDYSLDDMSGEKGGNSISLHQPQEADIEDFLDNMATAFPGDDFLNSFIDLSNFSTEDQNEAAPSPTAVCEKDSDSVAPVIHLAETEVGVTLETAGQKRKFADVEYVLVDPVSAGLDHDYTSKRARIEKQEVIVDPFDQEPSSLVPKSQRTAAEKYRDRRIKNNIASQRSREIRKMKFSQMETEADRLVGENQRLRDKIELLENLAKEMKASLISKIAGNK